MHGDLIPHVDFVFEKTKTSEWHSHVATCGDRVNRLFAHQTEFVKKLPVF